MIKKFEEPIVLKIRQSYHGTGGTEGYKFQVYDIFGYLGELSDVPESIAVCDVIELNGVYYEVAQIADSDYTNKEDDPNDEVVYYYLKEFVFKPNYCLKYL